MKYENRNDRRMKMHGYDRRHDIVNHKDIQDGWKMKEDRRHAKRHDLFPEDDTVGRITICR